MPFSKYVSLIALILACLFSSPACYAQWTQDAYVIDSVTYTTVPAQGDPDGLHGSGGTGNPGVNANAACYLGGDSISTTVIAHRDFIYVGEDPPDLEMHGTAPIYGSVSGSGSCSSKVTVDGVEEASATGPPSYFPNTATWLKIVFQSYANSFRNYTSHITLVVSAANNTASAGAGASTGL